MTIYDSTGAIIYEAPITKSSVIKRELMGDYYIELTFDAVERVDVRRGCYILYNSHKLEVMSNVMPDDTNNGGLRYTLRFEAQQGHMKRCKVFWRGGENVEVSFSNTTSLDLFGELIVSNINAFLGDNTWSLGSVPQELKKTLKTVSFNGDSCWDAVVNIAETFGVEWWTEEIGNNVSLCFGKLEYGEEVEFKRGDIVSSIPPKRGDDSNYGTRFYVFGSTRNLPADYDSTDVGGIVNHIVEKRLHLPDGKMYIDAYDNLPKEDIVEQVVFFDDIFPTNVDDVTSVDVSYEEVVEGRQDAVYTIFAENTPFSPENIIDGEQIQINFTSGDLIGQTFNVEINTASFDKRFKILPNVLDADSGVIIPNQSLKPNNGDTFVLIGIKLPNERIQEAELLLLQAGEEYAKKNSSDTEVYDCPTNAVYCHENNCNYDVGQRVILVDGKFVGGRSSRIQGYEKKLYDEYQSVYTVGDNSPYSRLASVEKAIQKSVYSERVGLEANIIKSRSDSTTPTDYNIYSALASEAYFLSKKRGGIVYGEVDFWGGLNVNQEPIYYDVALRRWVFRSSVSTLDKMFIGGCEVFYNSEKNALVVKGNLLVEKGLAWNSSIEGFEPKTITDAVMIDSNTLGRNENGEIYVKGGAGGGGSIAYPLTWSGYSQGIWDGSAPANISIPSLMSQMFNDSDYITTASVNSLLTDYLPKSGGVVSGDISIPVARATRDNSIPASGGLGRYGKNYYDAIPELKTFVGTIESSDFGWQHTISVRHRNGYSDGATEGLVFRHSLVNTNDSIHWSHQRGGVWSDDRVLLDSSNYSSYALPITGGAVSGNITANSLSVYGTTLLSYTAGDFPFKDVLNFTWSESTGDGIKLSVPGYHAEDIFLHLTVGGGAVFNSSVTAPKFIGALQGNADSATLWSYNSPWVQDFNALNYSNNGLYHFDGDYLNLIGGPPHNSWNYSVLNMGSGSGRRQQVAIPYSSSRMFLRVNVDDNWKSWREFAFLDSDNFTPASGKMTVNGDIQAPLFKIANNTSETAISFPSGECIDIWGNVRFSSSSESWSVSKDGSPLLRVLASNGSVGIGTGYMSLTQKFNVYGGIDIFEDGSEYSGVIGLNRKSASGGRYNPNFAAWQIQNHNGNIEFYDDDYGPQVLIYSGGDVKLQVNGNFLATGRIAWNSSRVLKDIIGERYLTLDELAQIKPYQYKWKDGRDDLVHAGAIADEVMEIMPETVLTDSLGIHSMDYAQTAFVMAASLTPYVSDHERRIKDLETENKALKEEIEKLKRAA